MKNFKKVLSLLLAVVMVMGSLAIAPMNASASSEYTKVTDVSTITDGGNFVIIAKVESGETVTYYALDNVDGGWLCGTAVTAESTTIPVIKIAASGANVTLTTEDGDAICGTYSTSKDVKNKVLTDASTYTATWSVSEVGEDTFSFLLTGNTDTETPTNTNRYMSLTSEGKARPYQSSYATSQSYVVEYLVYEYSGEVAPPPADIELPEGATEEEIVNAAYQAMENGVDLLGTWSLTGVITAIGDKYTGEGDYKNVSITIQVGEMTEKLIGGYQVTVSDTTDAEAMAMLQGLAVGDTVKLTGTLGYYKTTVQFVKGSIIELVKKAENAPQDIELPEGATEEEIVNAAYQAMENGVDLLGTWSLTGVITAIGDKYTGEGDYKNVSITIQVGEMTEKLIGGYQVTVSDTTDAEAMAMLQGLAVGDTVKLTGTLGYYKTTVQFVKGSIIELVKKAENAPQDIELPADATEEDIVNAAYEAMENGVSLLGTWELTGVITEINTEYSDSYKNISVTIQVGNMTDKPIQCYRLTVADKDSEAALAILEGLEVGDEITAQGTFTYYNTTVEFAAGCVLLEVNGTPVTTQAPDTIDVISTGAGIVLVSGIALLAIVEMKKRR